MSAVGAVYDRTFFVDSTKYARSQTAPTVRQLQLFEICRSESFSLREKVARRSASLIGRSLKGGPDEGRHAEISRHSRPHPALRATLSRRERDPPLNDGRAIPPDSEGELHFGG